MELATLEAIVIVILATLNVVQFFLRKPKVLRKDPPQVRAERWLKDVSVYSKEKIPKRIYQPGEVGYTIPIVHDEFHLDSGDEELKEKVKAIKDLEHKTIESVKNVQTSDYANALEALKALETKNN